MGLGRRWLHGREPHHATAPGWTVFLAGRRPAEWPRTRAQRSAWHLASGCQGTAGDSRKRRRQGTTQDALHCGPRRQHAGSCCHQGMCRRRPMSSARSHAECRRSPAAERRPTQARPDFRIWNALPCGGGSHDRGRGAGAQASALGGRCRPYRPIGPRIGAIRCTQECYRFVTPFRHTPAIECSVLADNECPIAGS